MLSIKGVIYRCDGPCGRFFHVNCIPADRQSGMLSRISWCCDDCLFPLDAPHASLSHTASKKKRTGITSQTSAKREPVDLKYDSDKRAFYVPLDEDRNELLAPGVVFVVNTGTAVCVKCVTCYTSES